MAFELRWGFEGEGKKPFDSLTNCYRHAISQIKRTKLSYSLDELSICAFDQLLGVGFFICCWIQQCLEVKRGN
jgi:hypothetical protein